MPIIRNYSNFSLAIHFVTIFVLTRLDWVRWNLFEIFLNRNKRHARPMLKCTFRPYTYTSSRCKCFRMTARSLELDVHCMPYGWTSQSQIGGFLQCMKTKRLAEIYRSMKLHFTVAVPNLPSCCCCCCCWCFHLCDGFFLCVVYGLCVCLLFFYTCRNHRSEKDSCAAISKTLLRSSLYIIAKLLLDLLLLQFLNVFSPTLAVYVLLVPFIFHCIWCGFFGVFSSCFVFWIVLAFNKIRRLHAAYQEMNQQRVALSNTAQSVYALHTFTIHIISYSSQSYWKLGDHYGLIAMKFVEFFHSIFFPSNSKYKSKTNVNTHK